MNDIDINTGDGKGCFWACLGIALAILAFAVYDGKLLLT